MGIFLALAGYAAYAVFLGRSISLVFELRRAPGDPGGAAPGGAGSVGAYARAALDILFLLRLLRTNDLLWVPEWIFHVSLALVAVRHLRYVLEPVPAWVAALQPLGLAAGYVLPAALAAIMAVKWRRRKEGYFSSANFLLLALLLAGTATGLGLKHLARVDLVAVKIFMLGFFSFRPGAAPGDGLLAAHLLLAFLLLARLPSHVVTAPFTIVEANRRDAKLGRILHD